jgi:hypothetical protein
LLNLLWANNYDNALALSFLPAAAGVSYLIKPEDWRWAGVLAGLGIGVLYCYPEMAAVVIGGGCLFLVQRFLSESKMSKGWLFLLLCAAGLILVGIAPFAQDFVWFIKNQVAAGTGGQGVRPGEGMFHDLLDPQYRLMAFWGLGRFGNPSVVWGGLTETIWRYGETSFAFVLSVLAVLGAVDLLRQKDWGLLLTIVLLCSGSFIMILHFAYSYGAYKFILLNWWGMCFAVVQGSMRLTARFHARWFSRKKALLFGLLAFGGFLGPKIIAFHSKVSPYSSALPFKQVEEVKDLISGGAVLVAIDNDMANEWAVYFLREVPIYLSAYRSYMAQSHVVPLMERAKRIELTDVRYALTDNTESFVFPDTKRLWAGGPYNLWKLADNWVIISDLHNPNGIENWEGKRGFWVGKGDTEIDFVSSKNGQLMIEGQFRRGPSLPERAIREMLIYTEHGYHASVTIVQDGQQLLSVPVSAGKNALFFRSLDEPTVTRLPNGDTRPLLLGIRGLRIVGFEARSELQ